MNAGVLYFLDNVEDLYIRVLSVLVSILDPNHIVFTSSNKLYQYVFMYVCMAITYSRVWINRVRLPILLVVS